MICKLDKKDLTALFVCTIFFLIFAAFAIYRYYNFHYTDWDLAFFSQAMWNLLNGKQFVSLFGINFFSNHSNLIALLILPFYGLWPHPLLLVFLKILSFTGGAFVFYLIAKRSESFAPAIILMVLYLTYMPNLFGLIYEFHFESIAPFFLFLLYFAFTRNRKVLFFMTALILMLIKENMPLIIVAFGIYAFFSKKKDRIFWSVLPVASGLLVFYFLTSTFIPYFSSADTHHYLTHYGYLGTTSIFDLTGSALANPMKVFQALFSVKNILLLNALLVPLLYLPLLSLQTLFLISPILLQHFSSTVLQEKSMFFHYWLTVSPFLFLAMMQALKSLQKYYSKKFQWATLVFLILLGMFNFHMRETEFFRRALLDMSLNQQFNKEKRSLIKFIPKDAEVVATFGFLPELSRREHLYSFHKIFSIKYQKKVRPFALPKNVNYALIDYGDRWMTEELVMSKSMFQFASKNLQEFTLQGSWFLKESVDTAVLLEKNGASKRHLIEVLDGEQSLRTGQPIQTMNNELALLDIQLHSKELFEKKLLSFDILWRIVKEVKNEYLMIFIVRKDDRSTVIARNPGYRFYPPRIWPKGKMIMEYYAFPLPQWGKGNYTIAAGLLDETDIRALGAHIDDATYISGTMKAKKVFIVEN